MKSPKPLQYSAGLLALAAAAVIGDASAATATGTLAVNATVIASCLISSPVLSFGNYIPTDGSPKDGSANLTLTCTPGTAYKIGFDAGGGGGTVSTRAMKSGSDVLSYALFRDSSRTLNWGNTGGTDTVDGTSTLGTLINTIPVYGRIPAGQAVPAGAGYADSVAITVTY